MCVRGEAVATSKDLCFVCVCVCESVCIEEKKTRTSFDLNRFTALIRSLCDLSPWIPKQLNPALCKFTSSLAASFLYNANTKTLCVCVCEYM